jgi:hypothetical protein
VLELKAGNWLLKTNPTSCFAVAKIDGGWHAPRSRIGPRKATKRVLARHERF